MRIASGQQGENEEKWKKNIKANRNTSKKTFGEHKRQLLHEKLCATISF